MNYRFEGAERIELTVAEATRTVTCHAVELHVFNVSASYVAQDETKTLECQQIQYTASDESVSFTFEEALPVGALVTLKLQFHGFLNDQLRGFYRTEYDLAQEKRVCAVTQFEACDARRAFVCWDEPAIKAKYEISIVTEPELMALSNTHVVQTQLRPKKNAHLRKLTRKDDPMEKVWKFAETPIMSTYLVAMVVGEFDQRTDVSKEGVIVNVYTAPGQSERGRFSLDVAVKALSFFTDRFGIPYPLKKLDMVAIPDFLGAMENWGLVTYTETYLLVDAQKSSHEVKIEAARTVCHELSHQWFGNLVTMDWWTGLWLNEGFAQFMEFEAVNAIFPEWRIWELFVQQVHMGSALVKDSMLTSHPIEVVVHHPQEVDDIFDVISYHKGASVVRMLCEYLGQDVFYRGVHNYLVKFSYKNTKTEDLWFALEEASGQSITSMAGSWTEQMGFPLLTVQEKSDGAYELVQERFFADKTLNKENDASLWDVPLTLLSSESPKEIKRVGIWNARTNSTTDSKTPLGAPQEVNQQIQLPSPTGWIKLNPNQASFFLVNYPPALWKRLHSPVQDLTFGVVDRVSLLNNIFALARAGVLDVPQALDFTSAYINEPEFLCWKEISVKLAYYSTLFHEEAFYPELQHYIRTLFSHVMQRLGWESLAGAAEEGTNQGEFRKVVISRLGFGGDHAVIQEAKHRFQAYMAGDTNAVSADLRGVVFRIQATHGDETHATQLMELYERSDFGEEKEDVLMAVGQVPLARTKLQVIEWALAKVRQQDLSMVFNSLASDRMGAEITWQYLQDNYDTLSKKFSGMMFGRLVCPVVGNFQSESRAVEVEAFMADKNTGGYQRRLEGALESVRLKSVGFHRDRDAVATWLKTRAV